MGIPEDENYYLDRQQKLSAVLDTFIEKPSNFDSRAGIGIAQRIHRVEPTNEPEDELLHRFRLKATVGINENFGPVELAQWLSDAYRHKALDNKLPFSQETWEEETWDDTWGEVVHESARIDPILSELSLFFKDCAFTLQKNEMEKAIVNSRNKRNEGDLESYQLETLMRENKRDPHIEQLASLKCCEYCFRLIPEREGNTKSTIGKTCVHHDTRVSHNIYRPNRERILSKRAELSRQRESKRIDVQSNAADPQFVPERLHHLMSISLSNSGMELNSNNPFFQFTLYLFSTPENNLLNTDLLNNLLKLVEAYFPPIARPAEFSAKVRNLIDQSEHTPKKVHEVIGWFVFDCRLPLHPKIIALYMMYFWEESWFAQDHDPYYYGSRRRAGRPSKVDSGKLIKEAKILQKAGILKRSVVVKKLAEQFGCSVVRVRQLLKDHNIQC